MHRTTAKRLLSGFSSILFLVASGHGVGVQAADPHYLVPKSTWSPDHRTGVTVPALEFEDAIKVPKNRLVEVKTGRVIADIVGLEAWDRTNHGGYLAKWAADGSLLHWEVGGKWFPMTLAIIKLKDNKVEWQADLMPVCQKAILARTKVAAPAQYEAEKKANEGNGEAYPEGFSVDVRTDDTDEQPVKLPLKVHVDLTSDPKEGHPGMLDSWLDGVLGEDGKFTILSFKLGRRPGLDNSWSSP